MTHTSARTWQYLGLIVIALALGGGYWYFQVRAGGRLNAPQTGTLTSGLVGYWTFDGADTTSSIATDKSTTGANGTLTNGPAKVAGKVGQALNFWPNGVDTQAYVHIGDPAGGQLDFGSGDFSVGFWMKTSGYVDQSSSVNVPLSKTAVGTGNAAGYYFQYGSSNQLQFVVRNGSTTYALSTPASIVGDWHYYMGVRSGSTIYFYQDGVSVGSTAVSGSTSNSEFFQVGSYGAGGPYFNVNGSMDEVRVYNRALAVGEIQSLYDLGSSDKINSSVSQKQGGGTLANGLAGYWALDDGSGTNANDASTNNNDGTLTNGPTWGTGQIGSAVTFDGSNDYITAPHSTALNFNYNENFSIALWVKIPATQNNTTAGANEILTKWVNTGPYPYYIAILNQTFATVGDRGKISVARYDGTNNPYVRSASAINDNIWHHVNVIKRGSTLSLYIDGNLSSTATDTTTTTTTNASPLYIGEESGTAYPLTGSVDDVRIYSRTLSVDEVSQLYRLTTPTDVDTGLKGYWSFDGADISGTTAYDRSGAGNNGTLTNGPTVTPGAVGQALNFDGTDDYVDVGSSSNLNLSGANAFTLSAWVYPTSTPQGASVITEMFTPTSSTVQYELGFGMNEGPGGSSYLKVGFYRDGSWRLAADSVSATLNAWTYIAGTWNGTTLSLYKNGSLVTATTPGSSLPSSSFDKVVIGSRHDAAGSVNFFPGKIDEPRIYNRALTASEIQSLYDQGAPDKINSAASTPQGTGRLDSGLAGYWKFDDGSGSSATDASPNGTSLTLTNSPTWGTGRIGSALTFFPGGSDANALASVSDPASGVLDFGTGDFAVSFWAKGRGYTSQGSSGNVLVGKKNVDSGSAAGWYFGINSSSVLQMDVNTSSSDLFIGGSTPVLNDDAWHHIVGLRTGSTVKLYADGVFIASGTKSGDVSNANAFWVGDDGSTLRNFKGEIDEVRTYNRALSEDEISQLYRLGTPTGTDTSLKGYWSFNGQDVSGTTAYDRSGTGNNGTLTNGPTVTPGKLGQALNFDETDDYVNLGDVAAAEINASSFTVSVWVKADSLASASNRRFILSKGGAAFTYEWEVSLNGYLSPQKFRASIYQQASASAYIYADSTTTPALGEWYHLAFVFNSATPSMQVYLNGVAEGYSTSTTGTVVFNGTNSFQIGRRQDGAEQLWDGSIDEVRIYNRALGASEIAALYNQSR